MNGIEIIILSWLAGLIIWLIGVLTIAIFEEPIIISIAAKIGAVIMLLGTVIGLIIMLINFLT